MQAKFAGLQWFANWLADADGQIRAAAEDQQQSLTTALYVPRHGIDRVLPVQ